MSSQTLAQPKERQVTSINMNKSPLDEDVWKGTDVSGLVRTTVDPEKRSMAGLYTHTYDKLAGSKKVCCES
jgi:hypothetical protein